MRSIKLIVLLCLIMSPALMKAQVIKWQVDRPLTWVDFKGKPDYKAGAGSITYWNTTYNYQCEFRDCSYVVTFNIENDFDARSSWVMWDQQNEYLLAHEQLHFDINELFTRKLAAAFHEAVFTSNFKKEIEDLYNKSMAECAVMESKYDADSEHSSNTNMQLRWQLFIYLQLRALPRNY